MNQEIVDKKISDIEGIRATNNGFWMELLKIALKHSPEETRIVLKNIVANDKVITSKVADILRELKK